MLDILAFYAIIAIVFAMGKQSLSNGAPFFLCALRLIPAGLIFLISVYIFDRKNFFIKKNAVKSLLWFTLFIFLMDVLRFIGLLYISASYGVLITTLFPFIASLCAWYKYKEPFSAKKIFALFIGAAAILPIVISNLTAHTTESKFYILIGYLTMLISTTSGVLRTFFLKDLVDVKKHAIFMILGCTFFISGIGTLLLSFLYESWNPIPCKNFLAILPSIIILMISYNMFSQSLYAYLVKKYPVTLVTFFMFITPLITATLDFFLYGKRIHFIFIFSCILLAGAFLLFYNEEKKEKLL